MLASDLLSLLNHAFNDGDDDAMTETMKLKALSEAMIIVSSLIPVSHVVTGNIDLVAGIEQSLPTDCVRLLRLNYNTGSDGATIGRVVKPTTLEKKNATSISWPSVTGALLAEYIYDPDVDAKTFLAIP